MTDYSQFDTTVRVRWGRVLVVWVAVVLAVVGLTQLWSCAPAHASAMECPADSGMDSQKAIHAIVNEAGSSLAEMRAVAWAIANRGTWSGVYGLRKPFKPSEMALERANRAWHEVSDDNHGGDHWLSDYDLRYCKPRLTAFRFKMKEVGYYGTTHFYRS